MIQFTVPEAEGELTDRNNTALVQINGVRDRLRVLLVSGEPHAGGRTWRNLLKSDSLGRPRAFHHPAPPGKAGRRAGRRTVADRLPDPRAVPGEDRGFRPHHLRPLQAARHPAVDLSRQRAQLCRTGRRAADLRRTRLCQRRQPLPLAPGLDPARRTHGARDRRRLPPRHHRPWPAPSGDRRPAGCRATGAAGCARSR